MFCPNTNTKFHEPYQYNHMIPRLVKGTFLKVTATDHVRRKGKKKTLSDLILLSSVASKLLKGVVSFIQTKLSLI